MSFDHSSKKYIADNEQEALAKFIMYFHLGSSMDGIYTRYVDDARYTIEVKKGGN